MTRRVWLAPLAFWRVGAFCAAMALSVAGASVRAEHSETGGPFAFHTFLSYDSSHGVQIEYMSGDGGAYLWYPGEDKAISGEWRVLGDEVCFNYPGYGFDIVPDVPPGETHCMTIAYFFETTLAKIENDPFVLSAGGVPFKLSPGDFFAGFAAVQAAIEAGRR